MSRITVNMGINFEGCILPGDYKIDKYSINVSYPGEINCGLGVPVKLPIGASAVYQVSWNDDKGRSERQLRSNSYEKRTPIFEALAALTKLFTAFKLVRIGHSDGLHIKTVGIADTLFYWSVAGKVQVGDLNMGLRLRPFIPGMEHNFDPHGSTALATPHINQNTYPVARKYVRCFELLERGYYNEAIVVSFSILDDLTQEMIKSLLKTKGLQQSADQDIFMRSIKESRLKIYLGPMLKVLTGFTVESIWAEADKAISWLNTLRNNIAHNGLTANQDDANKSIFVCIQLTAGFHKHMLIAADIPWSMFRQARLGAAWTANPPKWVPTNSDVDINPFQD